jgi:hypothetical protein
LSTRGCGDHVVSRACILPVPVNPASPLLTKSLISRGNKTGSHLFTEGNHDKNLLPESVTMSGAASVILVESLAKGVRNVSTHHMEPRCKHPSPQLVGYLQASSEVDPFTGGASVGVESKPEKSERDMERFLKDWDKEWHKISAKKHG